MALSPVEEFFHKIAKDGDLEELKKMVNSKDERQKTPLHKAAENGSLEMVKILIEMGADIDAKDEGKATPLHYCILVGNIEIVKILLQKGADMEARLEGEVISVCTPLHVAVKFSHMDIVKLLLGNGAQINTQDKIGNTVLHHTVENDTYHFDPFDPYFFLEIVKYLLEHGAQVDIRNNDNKTPFDLANEHQNFEMAKILLEKKRDELDKNPLANMSNKASCVICFSRRNELFVLTPCGHTTLCEPCCYKLKHEQNSKCPNCRKPIQDYVKIFFGEPE